MQFRRLCVTLWIAVTIGQAQQPAPQLRVEATDGGSAFVLRNEASQPLTAFLIELVDYPGSSYALSQDEIAGGNEPLAAGATRRIPILNMTIEAAPDYVKITAAIYADGTTSGSAEKVAQLVGRRKLYLSLTRDVASRLEKARAEGAGRTSLVASLRQWADSIPQSASKTKRAHPDIVNQETTRSFVADAAARLEKMPIEEVLSRLRATERALVASKPPL